MWTWVSIPPGIRVRWRRSQVGFSRGVFSIPTIRDPSTITVTSLIDPPRPSRSLPTRRVTGSAPQAGRTSAAKDRRARAERSALIIPRSFSSERPQRRFEPRQGGVDAGQRDRAGTQAEPAVVLSRAEGLEGDDADARRLQQPAADLLVGAQLAPGGPAAERVD